jgi:hypothetical protein
MVRLVEMSRGMAARRAVTTADVTAGEAETEMNPRCAEFQALFASLSPGGSRNETLQMVAAHHRTFWRVVASFESSLLRCKT